MKDIVFATNNAHKLAEARRMAGTRLNILSLADIGCHDDIPETAPDIEGNSLLKARYIYERYGLPCFADDTGLFVTALDGAPGVRSARFAGDHASDNDNVRLLLDKMQGVEDRSAAFRTVVTLIMPENADGDEDARFSNMPEACPYVIFEGAVKGRIDTAPHGNNGFGYDPVFIPDESGIHFALMTQDQKNAISHRGRALTKLFDYLLK